MSDYQGAEGWDTVQAGLAAVVTDHGRRISEDAGRLRAALSDQLGAAGHAYRGLADAVVVAAEEHIPADLIAGASGHPARTYAELLAALTARGFAQPLAATVIERWRAVLVAQRPAPPPAAPPAPTPPPATAPPLVPPVVPPPPPPPVVPPVVPPLVPTVAVNDASAPTHLAGQQPPEPAPWSTPGADSSPQPKPPPSPSRRYAWMFVASLALVAVAFGLMWFEQRGSGTGTASPGGPSSSGSGSPQGTLAAPQALSASTGPGTISLSWQSVDGATRYDVTRDGTTVSGANQSTTSFTDTVTDTSQHSYTVAAVNSTGPGPVAAITASADAVIPSTGSASTDRTAAEATLIATLPTGAVDTASCKPYPDGEDANADASVMCDSNGTIGNPPTSIFAYHYVSAAAQRAATASSVSYYHLPPGKCTTNAQGVTTWAFDNAISETVGALLCFDTTPDHVIRWDYDSGQVSIEGWTPNGTLVDLLKWWRNARPAQLNPG